jgi:hypothetical protein
VSAPPRAEANEKFCDEDFSSGDAFEVAEHYVTGHEEEREEYGLLQGGGNNYNNVATPPLMPRYLSIQCRPMKLHILLPKLRPKMCSFIDRSCTSLLATHISKLGSSQINEWLSVISSITDA